MNGEVDQRSSPPSATCNSAHNYAVTQHPLFGRSGRPSASGQRGAGYIRAGVLLSRAGLRPICHDAVVGAAGAGAAGAGAERRSICGEDQPLSSISWSFRLCLSMSVPAAYPGESRTPLCGMLRPASGARSGTPGGSFGLLISVSPQPPGEVGSSAGRHRPQVGDGVAHDGGEVPAVVSWLGRFHLKPS
jgi:hypothetical protein